MFGLQKGCNGLPLKLSGRKFASPVQSNSRKQVRREMMPEVDSFDPFVTSQNRRGHPRSYSQYYEGMQEKLSPSGSHKEKFFNKTWRNRLKVVSNAGNALWIPQDDFSWSSVEGRKVQLTSIPLSALSEPECIALQRVAQTRLKQMDFKSHVTIPKDPRSPRKSLKRALSWKTKTSGSGLSDKENGVFAIPLHKAVTSQGVMDTSELKKGQRNVKESTPSISSTNSAGNQEVPEESPKVRRHSSGSSLSQSSRSSNENSNQNSDYKSLSASCLMDKQSALSPPTPQVPPIVLQAVEHLQLHGLHVLGIFRVGGSKKRMKQMRDQFDLGEKTSFTAEDDNPHDVAALFKEYFRDLPEPLLTRDLYSAFLETQSFEDQSTQITALRLLCCLLPIPNRDTLKVLLEFLAEVAQWSEDRIGENGVEIPGNKMNSKNLAIIIGPNILHKVKGQHHDFLVEDKARADERKEIIDVVQDMIENHDKLFEISAEVHHDILLQLLDNEPEIVDYILRRKLLRTNGTSFDMEDELFNLGETEKLELPMRGRVQSAGAIERSRGVNTPLSRSHGDTSLRPRHYLPKRSSSDKTHYNPGFPVRSHSLNQEEARHYRDNVFWRQMSTPDDNLSPPSYNYNYRQNKRRTPPITRTICRYDGSDEPPSPSLSSTSPSVSYSNYSTPPSSPSGSGAYVSADSNSSSPLPGRAYIEDDRPALSEWTFHTEIDVELTHEGDMYPRRRSPSPFTFSDWQLENWFQWESLTQQNSSQKDFLEQETLV
ncbi:Rho GTPase-activating protein 6 [Porites harrisoni]